MARVLREGEICLTSIDAFLEQDDAFATDMTLDVTGMKLSLYIV